MTDFFKERARLKTELRSFFLAKDYLEIDTPILVTMPGAEVHLDYFETKWSDHQRKDHQLFLRSSPEIHMKRTVAAGHDSVFQIAPSFRNCGEHSDWHHPEFTMLEWYTANGNLDSLIKDTAALISDLQISWSKKAGESPQTFSVQELFVEHVGLDPFTEDFLPKAQYQKPTNITKDDDAETAFFKIMLDIIEPKLRSIGVCFVHGYPASTASLAAIEGGVAQRVELYLDGVEAGNGFVELTGDKANGDRIYQILHARDEHKKKLHPVDEGFLKAMQDFPPCVGNAVGFDRLLAWLLGHNNISQVIPFRNDF